MSRNASSQASIEASNVEVVRRYFGACQSGVYEDLLATLDAGVIHYFLAPAFKPIRGAEALARYWVDYKAKLDPRWSVDHALARGDEVVVEWSCRFTSRKTGERLTVRGTDWYVLRDGRIAEIRAYFIADGSATTELATFPYAERGYLVGD